mmetsp:Transcript_11996/g.18532  ORF Transcript_11996/g.18532 Transcript_11996/m.18532 type:complete len:244 (+) Transcript_11996:51-782(+)
MTTDRISTPFHVTNMIIPETISSHANATKLLPENEDSCNCHSFPDEDRCIHEDSDWRQELSNPKCAKRPRHEEYTAERHKILVGVNGIKRARTTENKHVSFQEVRVRFYDRVFGDHPCCKQGPPVSLGWNVLKDESYDFEKYDHERPHHASKKAFKLSAHQREKLLVKWGFSRKKMREEVKFRQIISSCEETTTATRSQNYDNECHDVHREPSVVLKRTGRPRLWIPDTEPKDDRIPSLIMGF